MSSGRYDNITDKQAAKLTVALAPFFAGEEQDVLIRGYDLMLGFVNDRVGALPASLVSMGNAVTAANNILYTTAPDTYSNTLLTPYVRGALAAADALAFRTYINAQAIINNADDISEGTVNKYYTDARVDARGVTNGWVSNPMSALGDMIVGGASGAATRLAAGTNGQVLTIVAGAPVWQTSAAGVSDHGALTGLTDDDHTQYYNQTRGDARYAQISHTHTIANVTGLQTALDSKEPTITAGTTSQYWRGDKSWQTLDKSAVGLGLVDNTAGSTYLNRANHTGTQAASTISDFSTAADARISAAVGVSVQAFDADLSAIAALAGTSGLARKTAANTWSLDTSVYLTGNQSIALSGDASGSGTTAVAVTLATVNGSPVTNGFHKVTTNGKGLVTGSSAVTASDLHTTYGSQPATFVYAAPSGSAGNPSFRALVASDIPALSYQAQDGDLTSLSAATGTNTIYYRSAADTWSPVTIGTNLTFSAGTLSATGGGGGGAPGGTNGQVQYNNAGAFAGATDVTIADEQLCLIESSSVPAPAAGSIKMFAKAMGGRLLPAAMGQSGQNTTLQPHLGRNRISSWTAVGNGSTITAFGDIALTATGTGTTANFATTRLYTKLRRTEWLVTTAATNAIASFRLASAKWTIGDTSTEGAGGFTFVCTWAPATGVATTTTRAFCGMGNATGAPTDVEPSSITNIVGMGWDAADTNIQIMHRGAGAVTKIDLGASFPVPTVDRTKVYELSMFSPPGTTQSVGYQVKDLVTGDIAQGTITTNMPTTSTALAPRGWISVGGTSSVIGIALMNLYIETDL